MRIALAGMFSVCLWLSTTANILADVVQPPSFTGKIIESISMVSDFIFTPGTWSECTEEPGESLTLSSCKITGGKFEVINGVNSAVVTLVNGYKIDATVSMEFYEYISHGTLDNGVPVMVDLFYRTDTSTWSGYVKINDATKHSLIVDQ